MKTTTIVIDMYKDELAGCEDDLGYKRGTLFEYSEYIKRLEVEIDENLNVIGGKLYPFTIPIPIKNKLK